MSHWHVSIDEIVNTWSEERLALMMKKLSERLKAQKDASEGKGKATQVTVKDLKPNYGEGG